MCLNLSDHQSFKNRLLKTLPGIYEAHGNPKPKIYKDIQEIKRKEPKYNTTESQQHTREESKIVRQ